MAERIVDLTAEEGAEGPEQALVKDRPAERPYDLERDREGTRGNLARGLLWLLTFTIGGVLVFIGIGKLEGRVLTETVFPALVSLAGTALGFYFGSQVARGDTASGPKTGAPSG